MWAVIYLLCETKSCSINASYARVHKIHASATVNFKILHMKAIMEFPLHTKQNKN